MAKNNEFKDTVSSFADRLKNTPAQVPVQKVTPLPEEKEKGRQLNVWIDDELATKLKVKSAQMGLKMKDVVAEAIRAYLKD